MPACSVLLSFDVYGSATSTYFRVWRFPIDFRPPLSPKGWKCSFGPLLMSVAPETLPTWRTGYLSNIVEGLRLKMKIGEVMAILRWVWRFSLWLFFFFSLKKWKYVNLDPLLMSVAPETLPTWRTGYLSNIVEGLRLKMKIDFTVTILRWVWRFFVDFRWFSLIFWKIQ